MRTKLQWAIKGLDIKFMEDFYKHLDKYKTAKSTDKDLSKFPKVIFNNKGDSTYEDSTSK